MFDDVMAAHRKVSIGINQVDKRSRPLEPAINRKTGHVLDLNVSPQMYGSLGSIINEKMASVV